jgi:putative DNA-invertase from lambdoid prophage Rac
MEEQVRAAVWYRVSTLEQHSDNQVPDVARFISHHGYQVAETFTMDDSAWKDGQGGPEYRAAVKAALDGAWQGKYSVLVVWALDRITRKGAEDALRLVRQFRERGCTIVSVKESWLNGAPEIVDVLVAFAGWVAQQESNRRSERTRAGLATRRAKGLPVGGRKPGSRDRKPRTRDGYLARWERERAAQGQASA